MEEDHERKNHSKFTIEVSDLFDTGNDMLIEYSPDLI